MRIAFVSLSVPGHAYPMSALARKLKFRGHDVVLISLADAEHLVRPSEVAFVPYCEKDYPLGSTGKILNRLAKLQGPEALAFSQRTVAELLEAAFRDLPQTLRRTGSGAVVLDAVQTALGLVPMHLDIPYVHVSNSLHLDFSGNTPINRFDWPYSTDAEAIARNKEGIREYLRLTEPQMSAARAYAKQIGLDVDCTDPLVGISKRSWLTQTPKEFDFPSSHWLPEFHHTGPFHDGLGRSDPEFPWERLTGEPLIYASMGTLQNGLEYVFNTIAEAVGTQRGTQLVLSVGSIVDPEHVKFLPPNAIVVKRAPQLELIRYSALCITHAGLNTTLESLAQGVPLVAIPITNDQPGVAARIAHTRTGAFVPLKKLTTPRLVALIDEVQSNPEYRRNALRMRRTIASTNGLEMAVDLLEQAFDLRAPTSIPRTPVSLNLPPA